MRILSHNIHRCLNLDGRYNAERTAKVIAALLPDIAALQEVDVYKKRSNYLHQAEYLATRLDMYQRFFPVKVKGTEKYGLAILSRYPIEELKCGYLPAAFPGKKREKRGVMTARIRTPLGVVRFMNTHFSLYPKDRILQVKFLLEEKQIPENADAAEGTILCGDFNAGPGSVVYKVLSEHLHDVQTAVPRKGYPKSTFISWCPIRRIDHIFTSRRFLPVRVRVPADYETKMASDHLPLFTELDLTKKYFRQ